MDQGHIVNLLDMALEEIDRLNGLMAEAWDEGMAAAKLQAAGIKRARNPYRPVVAGDE